MRRRLTLFVALALALPAAAGNATSIDPDEPIPDGVAQDEPIPDEAEPPTAPVPPTFVPGTSSSPPKTSVRPLPYQFSQSQRVDVGGGRTKVSVEQGLISPKSGYIPMQVVIDNTVGPRQVVSLTFKAYGSAVVSRQVEVNEGERRAVTLVVPTEMRSGTLSARGPGITERGTASVYFTAAYGGNRAILSLGKPESFEKFVGSPPAYSSATIQVATIGLADAPSELAAYVGFEAVVLPDEGALERLNEGQRRAIEAYAASGGAVVLKGPLRSKANFPLVGEPTGQQRYGFGVLDVEPGGAPPALLHSSRTLASNPDGSPPDYDRRYGGAKTWSALLPQATAPVGSFLLIMTLFTLLIGPGSVWVARRRGPAALLFTIPATAFVTCGLIVGYSLFSDGFTVHAASYGYTLLDSRQHRAITAGLEAYYANLAPRQATFSAMSVPIAPWRDNREHFSASIEWKDGARFGGDFVPSRIYREWGSVSVEPTRARVAVKKKGDGWVVQNALGGTARRLVVNLEGQKWHAEDVPDGAERELVSTGDLSLPKLPSSVDDRFGAEARSRVSTEALREHEFLAALEGQAFVPSGGVSVKHHDSQSLVRGEVEP